MSRGGDDAARDAVHGDRVLDIEPLGRDHEVPLIFAGLAECFGRRPIAGRVGADDARIVREQACSAIRHSRRLGCLERDGAARGRRAGADYRPPA
jgi:hypothetical protein